MDAARSWRHLRHRQPSRLHAARHSAGQAGLDDEDCRRQAGHANADHERADEVHHCQSDLECAGSIAANEYLPLLQQDPTILQRMGLQVSYNPDGTIHLSQPPGEQNALGQIRFNFPNKFLVYQHELEPKATIRQ